MITKDKKWAYTSGWDIFFRAEDDLGGTVFGIDKSYGFEYHFSKRMFISTEAQLNVGFGSDTEGPIIEFQLPLAIFVNVRLY
ncbi:MAG: hypothetical protein IPO92_00890 [Saprospiraceae bacterium]|nr:hypothetical protein [Saprospiraceae bacterium]